MGEILGTELPPSVMNFIRGGRIVIVSTVDADGRPNSAPFSWVVAKDNRTIRIGINQGVETLENIRRNGHVCLTITAPDLHISFKGSARVIRETIDEVPIPTAVVEITVEEVKDDAIIGRVESGQDRTRWTERRRVVSDSTIVAALLKA